MTTLTATVQAPKLRRHEWRRIAAMLADAVLILEYRHAVKGVSLTIDRKTDAASVMAIGKGRGFSRVWVSSNGVLSCHTADGTEFSAFPSVQAARRAMSRERFAKYFGGK